MSIVLDNRRYVAVKDAGENQRDLYLIVENFHFRFLGGDNDSNNVSKILTLSCSAEAPCLRVLGTERGDAEAAEVDVHIIYELGKTTRDLALRTTFKEGGEALEASVEVFWAMDEPSFDRLYNILKDACPGDCSVKIPLLGFEGVYPLVEIGGKKLNELFEILIRHVTPYNFRDCGDICQQHIKEGLNEVAIQYSSIW